MKLDYCEASFCEHILRQKQQIHFSRGCIVASKSKHYFSWACRTTRWWCESLTYAFGRSDDPRNFERRRSSSPPFGAQSLHCSCRRTKRTRESSSSISNKYDYPKRQHLLQWAKTGPTSAIKIFLLLLRTWQPWRILMLCWYLSWWVVEGDNTVAVVDDRFRLFEKKRSIMGHKWDAMRIWIIQNQATCFLGSCTPRANLIDKRSSVNLWVLVIHQPSVYHLPEDIQIYWR